MDVSIFQCKLIANEIHGKTGIAIPSWRIYNLRNVNGIGLYHVNVFSGFGQQSAYKLWVYSCDRLSLTLSRHGLLNGRAGTIND